MPTAGPTRKRHGVILSRRGDAEPWPCAPCAPTVQPGRACSCNLHLNHASPRPIRSTPCLRNEKLSLTTTLIPNCLPIRSHNRAKRRTWVTNRQPQGRSTTQAYCRWHGSGQWTRRGRDQRSNRAASLVKRISTRNRSLDGSAYFNRATLTRTLVTGSGRSRPCMDLCGRHARVL
jgi:hypothetical protein